MKNRVLRRKFLRLNSAKMSSTPPMPGDRAQSHNPAICETRGHEHAPPLEAAPPSVAAVAACCAPPWESGTPARAGRQRPSIVRPRVGRALACGLAAVAAVS